MNKQLISLLCCFVLICIFAACSSVTSNNPNEVLQIFFEKLARKDIDGASKYVTSDSKPTMQMMKKGLKMAEKMKDSLPENDPMKDFEDVSFSEARIVGDNAFITVSSKSKTRPDAEFKLLKESGGWKVDFTMSTLMKMGQKSMEHESSKITDSLHAGKEEIGKGLHKADSILKNIDLSELKEMQKSLENLK